LRAAGLPYRRELVYLLDDSATSLSPLAQAILKPPKAPTAIITGEDNIAARLIVEIEALGCRVPDDLSVVGFDDSWFSGLCRIPLTTMRLPQESMSEALVNLVVQRIRLPIEDRAARAGRVTFAGELVVRQSCGPPPNRQSP